MPADTVAIDERLTRLENRVKSGLFEIEKKFADISQAAPDAAHERLQEMEDLILLVQLENTKIKEKLGTQESLGTQPGGSDERVARLEAALEELRSTGPANIQDRLTGLEQKLSAQVKEGMDSRLSKLESDIKDLRVASGSLTSKDVQENIAKITTARIELDNSIAKFRSLKDEIEKGLNERKDLFSRLEQIELNVEKASTYFTKMKTEEEKMNAIAGRIESLNESIDAKVRNNTERVELVKRDMENRLVATEEKFKSRLEKLDSVMESLDIKSKGIDEKIGELQSIGKDLIDVASIKTGVEEQSLRVASVEKNLATINKRFSDMHKIRTEMEEELSIRASLEKKIDDVSARLNSLGKGVEIVNELDAHLEEEATLRQGLESRLQDIISEMPNIRSAKGEIAKAVASGMQAMEQKIQAMHPEQRFEELNASLEERLSAFDKKIADTEQTLETLREPVTRAREGMEKAAQEKTEEFSAELEELKQSLNLDEVKNIRNEIAEHRKVIQNLKADLEIAAARFFTANLEEFARALDKKFPGLVSRDEYTKSTNEILQRLKTIEAPDLGPLGARVELAERKLTDVHEMMQSLAKTMPIVLE